LIGVVALYLIYGIKDVIYKAPKPNADHVNTILTEDAGPHVQRDSAITAVSFKDSQHDPAQVENAEVKALKATEVLRCVGRELSTDP
jgi:hypothetical protein